ncbi:WYL domain-containing protein [Pseudomonas sp. 10C3]|uniref:WYL domain-containing protein n=1 Tax=Pseudomonas sp. 10C3 TaxID=3118753 RepID=UPI002E7FC73D|nr:WYL domain-containing protein [Pseudomonas sp. 10C3]MEE3508540.1 WYL domain-containing protein [Pseudomonas sp. 10C3]
MPPANNSPQGSAASFTINFADTDLVEQLDDGQLIVRCQVNHANQLLPLVRYWIPHVHILEPVWLQQKLRDELTDYLP